MSSNLIDNGGNPQRDAVQEEIGRRIIEALRGLRFGSVEIVVHDGKVVQFERRERVRMSPTGPDPSR